MLLRFSFFGALTVIFLDTVTRLVPALLVCTLTLHLARFFFRTRRRPLREIFTFVTLVSPAFREKLLARGRLAADRVTPALRASTSIVMLPVQPFTAVIGQVTLMRR